MGLRSFFPLAASLLVASCGPAGTGPGGSGPSVPTLASVTPASGNTGATVNVTVGGTGFDAGAIVTISGSHVAVSAVTVPSATQATATFTIDAVAATGARNVSVTTAEGTSNTATFTINAAAFAVDIDLNRGTVRFPNSYQNWQIGGGSATNFVAYPQGWTVGGGSASNFVPVPPGWSVGGGSATNFVAYPGNGVTTLELKFDDPGWLAFFQALQAGGSMTELQLADVVTYVYFTYRPEHINGSGNTATTHSQGDAATGVW
ncbi:MAG: IPT/TIG domain-containing protein [Gemmatimonadaceae bacterium]